jgi:hypothetical protein
MSKIDVAVGLMGDSSDASFQRAFMDIACRYPMKVLHTQGVINTRPALFESKAMSTGVALRQRLHQRLRLLQVGGVKALREPAVDRRQQRVGLGLLALLLPEATEAHGGP